MKSHIYKLHHRPFDIDYYFSRKPNIDDMIEVAKSHNFGYKFKGKKLISVENGIEAEWSIKSEFKISKLKFED